MVVLSIDPGTANSGFAVLSLEKFEGVVPEDIEVITNGTVHGKKKPGGGVRFSDISNITDAIEILLHEYIPEVMVVESFGASRRLNKATTIPMLRWCIITRALNLYPDLIIGEIRASDWRRLAVGNPKAEKPECLEKLQRIYRHIDMKNTTIDSVEAIGIGVGYLILKYNKKKQVKRKLPQ
jgi:Holliday junction resolvasome RuvABC endonuclease subunit